MSNNVTPILATFGWFAIPHGIDPLNPGCLRLTIRIAPKITEDAFEANRESFQIDALDRIKDPQGVDAIGNWPKFVYEKLSSIKLEFEHLGKICPYIVTENVLNQSLRQAWERQGVSQEMAEYIWKSIVYDELKIKPELRSHESSFLSDKSSGNSQDIILRSLAHIEGAGIIRQRIGEVWAGSLANGVIFNSFIKDDGDGSNPNLIQALNVETTQPKSFDGVASIYSGPPPEMSGASSFSRPEAINQVGALHRWVSSRLGLSAIKDEPFNLYKLSEKGSNLVDRRLRDWFDPDQDVLLKYPNTSEPQNADELAIFAVDKLICTAPERDRAGKSSSVATDSCEMEFHKQLAKLVCHPWLLEILGLTLDVAIPIQQVPLVNESEDIWKVSVNSFTIEGALERCTPDIKVAVVGKNGFPASCMTPTDDHQPIPIIKGCVKLGSLNSINEPEYVLEQLDIDSGVENFIQASLSRQTQFEAGVPSDKQSKALGTIPTKGISLLVRNQGDKQKSVKDKQLARSRKLKGREKILYAEDLVIGYRPDVVAIELKRGGQSQAHPWKSLVRRKLTRIARMGRDFTARLINSPEDEGFVMLMPRTNEPQGGAATTPKILLHFEELFRWQGWSLGAPPVECLERQDKSSFEKTCASKEPLQLTYRPFGGLPKLRIGCGYRVGLRAVYADGKSISLEEASKVYESNPLCTLGTQTLGKGAQNGAIPQDAKGVLIADYFLPFFRNEPIAPPDVLLREKLSQGRMTSEGRTRLIVGSTGLGTPVAPSTSRVLVPPRVDLEMAIRLGAYDDAALRARPPQSAFAGVHLNENGSFPSKRSLFGAKDRPDNSDGFTYFEPSTLACAPTVPYLPDPWAERLIIGIFRKADNQLLGIDYFDYYDDSQHKWPNCRYLDLRVKAVLSDVPPFGFKVNWSESALTIEISSGCELVVRCWFEMKEEMLGRAGTVEHMAQYLSSSDGAELRSRLKLSDHCEGNPEDVRACLIKQLSHWHERTPVKLHSYMTSNKSVEDVVLTSFECLNPAVELDVIHAVQVPTQAPECVHVQDLTSSMQDPTSRRFASAPVRNSALAEEFDLQRLCPGDTRAIFRGDIAFNRQTTSQVTCFGQWAWKNDEVGTKFRVDPAKPSSHLMFSLGAISAPLPGVLSNPHVMSGRATPELPIDNDLILLSGSRKSVNRHKNEDLDTCCSQQGNVEQKKLEFEFHDTKAKLVRFTLQAVSRSGDLFFKEPKQSSARRSELLTERWVKSSWPPKPPEVAYVHPLFDWNQKSSKATFSRTRVGGWFRIWLNRPWFSSGDGELLALVCWPPSLFDPPGGSSTYAANEHRMLLGRAWDKICDDLKCLKPETPDVKLENLYTGWGLDPIWEQSGARLSYIPAEAFTNRFIEDPVTAFPSQFIDWSKVIKCDEPSGGYTLPAGQLKKLKVALALYEPKYDETEQRWFVDVHLDPPKESCNPFVRLALARYQPNSLPGCELSEIRTAQFVQLTPSRAASVVISREVKERVLVQIRVAGASAKVPEVCLVQEDANKEGRSHVVVRLERRKLGLFSGAGTESDGFESLYDRGSDQPWVPFQRGVLGNDGSLPDSEGLYPGEVLLQYTQSSNSQSWSGSLAFTATGRYEYSLYLEERETIVVDKEPHKGGSVDPGRLGHRVVYADRLRIML